MELMHAWQNLHFLRPQLLWLLPPALLALWALGRRFRHRDGWQAVVDAHLLPAIRVQQGGKASGLLRLAMVVFVLGILALAGPSWHKKSLPVVKNQHALVIALDLSRSMLATDIKPNRLTRAKFKAEDLLKQRKDGQTALLAWAGDAFVVTPLTDDTQTIAAMLDSLDPSIMPVQGSRADKGLEQAEKLIRQAGLRRGDVLLIADGVNNPAARDKAAELARQGIRVHVLGVGTPEGAPIPERSGFFTDRQGNIVIPKLNENDLREVAQAGNGRYHRLSADDSDLRALLGDAAAMNAKGKNTQTEKTADEKQNEQWVDDGIWLLVLLVPLMAVLYRRGWLMVVVLAVGLHSGLPSAMAQESVQKAAQHAPKNPAATPANSPATPDGQKKQTPSRWQRLWENLWYNKNQQAARALKRGQADNAARLATDPRWKAAATYKSGQYKQAEKTWENLSDPSADDWYNRGNALAKAGALEQAIKAYEQALALQPQHADAAYNKKVVEEALKQQQNKQQSGQQNQEDQKNQQGQKDQQNQQGQQGQQGQKDQQNQQGQQGQKDQQNEKGQQGQENQQGQQDQQGQQGQKDQQNQQGQQGQNAENAADEAMDQGTPESEAEQQRQAEAMEEAQRQAEEKARQALAKKDPTGKPSEKRQAQTMAPVESAEEAEKEQAMEQWLRRIPDDPGGLLRRKFHYQYRQRQLNREVDRNDTQQDW